MGWFWKATAFILAVILIGAGAWQLSLLILAVLFIPPLFRALKRRPARQEGVKQKGRLPVRYMAAGLLFLLAYAGYLARGTFSPLVFASLGLLVVLWGRVPVSAVGSTMRPVKETVLMRSSPIPVSWAVVAEVKAITRDVGRALAGVEGFVVVHASETPAIYLVVERRALTERSAEKAVLASLREMALSLSPLGAYILPLDSQQAQALFHPCMEALKIGEADVSTALASGTYDYVSVRQERGFARAIGLYRKAGQGKDGRAAIPASTQVYARPPFLLEVFKALGDRLTWPGPDQYTAFLSSLFATSGEPIGTRILDAGAASQSQVMVVKSQGSPSVELSKAQLRALVRMYDKAAWKEVAGPD